MKPARCFRSFPIMPSLVKGLASTSFIPLLRSQHRSRCSRLGWSRLTPVEVHVQILLINVGSHGNNRDSRVNFSNHGSGRHTIQLWHDNIHEDQVKPVGVGVNLVNSFKTITLHIECQQVILQQTATGKTLTATSTPQSKLARNLLPILEQILSSSTSRILGFLAPHGDVAPGAPPGGLMVGTAVGGTVSGAVARAFWDSGRLYGMLAMCSAAKGSIPISCPTG